MNEMPTFDVSSIPMEFNPLTQNQGLDQPSAEALYAQDEKLHITFRTEAVLNPFKSTQAGRPIHDDVDMIIIRTPGSQLTSIIAPVKHYMTRFGEKYRKWKSTQMQAASGTPIENFPFLFTKPSLIAELKYRHIFTVEQLAELSDSAKQGIMGGHELSRRAAQWLEQTLLNAEDAEKAELRQKVADMEAQLAMLVANQMRDAQPKSAEPEVPSFMAQQAADPKRKKA